MGLLHWTLLKIKMIKDNVKLISVTAKIIEVITLRGETME